MQIHIRDTGIGIPYHELDEIFEAFTQVDDSTTRRAEGAGLGLPVSQRLCNLMGGEIRVKSTVGEGSTFTIRLPLHDPPAANGGEQVP
jgi:signal transduction histidine kinase